MKKGMKRSAIKKMTRDKINSWLDSIMDSKVSLIARRDLIVTGGSIASMLKGEEVNDYDIYFKTRESVRLVADYYATRFNANETRTNDVEVLTSSSNPYEFKRLAPLSNEHRVIMKVQSDGIAKAESKEMYEPIFISDNAITLTDDIQLIVRFFGTVEEIHSNFDFIHATCSYDYLEDKLVLPPKAIESLLSGDLYYSGSKYPVCSLFRLRKFLSRGWNITGGQILKISIQVSELDLMNVDVLRDQLVGVDTFYFLSIIDRILERKKKDSEFTLDSAYLSEVIDKVFE